LLQVFRHLIGCFVRVFVELLHQDHVGRRCQQVFPQQEIEHAVIVLVGGRVVKQRFQVEMQVRTAEPFFGFQQKILVSCAQQNELRTTLLRQQKQLTDCLIDDYG